MHPTDVPRIQKWGNSLAVRIPKSLAEAAGLRESAAITIAVEDGAIVVRVNEAPSLNELIERIRPGQLHEHIDFGRPMGKEIW